METTSAPVETVCYKIPRSRMGELGSRVTKLNRRAEKLGLPLVGYNVLRTVFEKVTDLDGNVVPGQVKVFEIVELTGTAPVVSGFTFLCAIQHTLGGNILSRAPGIKDDLKGYWDAPCRCEHCGVTRRRNDTFVLRAPDGSTKQVGRHCLADYLRTSDVDGALRVFSLLGDWRKRMAQLEEEGWGNAQAYLDPMELIATTLSCTRKHGWVSSTKARDEGGMSTGEWVRFVLYSPVKGLSAREMAARNELLPTQEDFTKAAEIMEWAKNLEPTNEYQHNLKSACSAGYLEDRNLNLVCSAVAAYRREQEKAQAATRVDAGYFGEPGKRYELQLKCMKALVIESEFYGPRTLCILEDVEGHCFKWMASGLVDLEEQKTYKGRCTIKAHEEYKGRKQTALSRCNLELVTPAEV